MSLDLQRELSDLASRAQQYADPHAVLREVRRRRRRGQLASVAAAVSVLAIVGTLALHHPTLTGPQQSTTAAPAPSIVEPPSVVDPPAGTVPGLPTDRGIGPAALAYQPTPGGPTYLVRPDGTQYRVPLPALADDNLVSRYRQFALSLSPDGRWLVIVGDQTTHVRDLTGTTVRTLDGLDLPEAWSPDGRWLVYLGQNGLALLDTASGRSWRLSGAGEDLIVVPTVDGHTLATPAAANAGHTLTLQLRDPVHGGPTEPVLVDAGGLLTADESLVWHFEVDPTASGGCSGTTTWMSQVSGDRLLLGVFPSPSATTCAATPTPTDPVAYVLTSVSTGRVLGRVSLPAGAGAPLWSGDDLVYPVQSAPTGRIRIETMDVTTGETHPRTSLPATAVFALDGAASPVAGPALA